MKKLTERLLYKGEHLDRQNVGWNIAGSFVYAFASMVLSFVVIRLAGEEQGGIFSFGFSTLGQQLFIGAYFGIRPFQITDGKREFSFGDYLGVRRLTTLLAAAAGFLFLLCRHLAYRAGLGDYTREKCTILFLLVLYKIIDGYADVYESEFQRQGSLYLTGKSNFFRTMLSVCMFTAVLSVNGGLLAACVAGVAAQLAGLALFNLGVIGALEHVDWSRGKGQSVRLIRSTLFLFVSVFLDFYIFSSAKYAIDARMDNRYSGYFNLIFMPTSVIYMVANFIIRPYLTKLTDLWNDEEYSAFAGVLGRIGGIILGLTALAAGATLLLGKWVLGIMELVGGVSAGSLSAHFAAFVVIVLGGGLYALANLLYYGLVIMRRQTLIFLVYALGALAAVPLSGGLVSEFGINGAAGCYLLLMMGLVLGFGLCMAVAYRRGRKEGVL